MRDIGAVSHEIRLVSCEVGALARLGDARAEAACAAGLALARRVGACSCEALLLRSRAVVTAEQVAGARRSPIARRRRRSWSSSGWRSSSRSPTARPACFGWRADERGIARAPRGPAPRERRIRANWGGTARVRDGRDADGGRAAPVGGSAGRLSPRERDVSMLVAAGLSNRQVAERLYISEKTAAHHVGSILGKLGFGSRAEIAAYVARHGGVLATESRA